MAGDPSSTRQWDTSPEARVLYLGGRYPQYRTGAQVM